MITAASRKEKKNQGLRERQYHMTGILNDSILLDEYEVASVGWFLEQL